MRKLTATGVIERQEYYRQETIDYVTEQLRHGKPKKDIARKIGISLSELAEIERVAAARNPRTARRFF